MGSDHSIYRLGYSPSRSADAAIGEYLFRTVESGDWAELSRFIQETPNAKVKRIVKSARDHYGYTLLMHAAANGHIELIQLLSSVVLGGDTNVVNAVADNGCSALVLAARYGRIAAVNQLLSMEGVDLEIKGRDDGATALLQAVDLGHSATAQAIMERLLLCNANIEARNHHGQTAVMVAAERGPGRVSVLTFLLVHKANTEARDQSGNTALLCAARSEREHGDALNALVAANADINATDAQGRNSLILASMSGSQKSISYLLSQGADIAFWSPALSQYATPTEARYLATLGYTPEKERMFGSAIWFAARRSWQLRSWHPEDVLIVALLRRFSLSTVISTLPELPKPISMLKGVYAELLSPWYGRVEYLRLFEGCYGPSLQGHIAKYLFDEIACREVCTFMPVSVSYQYKSKVWVHSHQ